MLSYLAALTQAYVADNKVANIKRHHKNKHKQYHVQIEFPVEIPGTAAKIQGLETFLCNKYMQTITPKSTVSYFKLYSADNKLTCYLRHQESQRL